MTTAYIVTQVSWNYNDQYYYRDEGGGSNPVIAYRNRNKALEHCLQDNINALKELEYLDEYSDDLESLMADPYTIDDLREVLYGDSETYKKLKTAYHTGCKNCDMEFVENTCSVCNAPRGVWVTTKEIEETLPDKDEWRSIVIPSDISDEKAAKVLDMISISWYQVVEVELDEVTENV